MNHKLKTNPNLTLILKKHFKCTYSNFILQGQILFKEDLEMLLEKFLSFDALALIKQNVSDLNKLLQILFEETLFIQNTDELYFENVLLRNNIKYELFKYLMNFYSKYFTNKQYFEIMPWIQKYVEINVNYIVFKLIMIDLYEKINSNKKSNSKLLFILEKCPIFYKHMNKLTNFEIFIQDVLSKKTTARFLGVIDNYKLDFTGSGQILISILINDAKFMEFSNVSKVKEHTLGYDKILEIFIENYNKDVENYANINNFLNLIVIEKTKEEIKKIIFSRSLVKNDLMVKGYSGTIYGSASKIEDKITKALVYNTYPLYYSDDLINPKNKLSKELKKTSMRIAKELNKIIEEVCPSISNRYLTLIKSIASCIKTITINNNNGIKIPNNITTYCINPKKRALLQIKLNAINTITKKLIRTSRRTISYYTPETNHKKLQLSLGADIIQGFDANVTYYIKRILKMINPSINVATIFDAFIFSEHIDIKTFKNICRLACQLTFSKNFVESLLKLNNIPNNDFYETFNNNIFSKFKENSLEKIIESEFYFYIFKNQYLLFKDDKTINKNFLFKAFKYLNEEEIKEYKIYFNSKKNDIRQLKQNNNSKEFSNDIKSLMNMYKIQFILKKIFDATTILHENFYNLSNKNTIIFALNNIMNNDNFIK
jgi:hypothetical protein